MKVKILITLFWVIIISTNGYCQDSPINCEIARKKYLELNPDVAKAGMDAWRHYNSYGKNEGRVWPQCVSEDSKVKNANSVDSETYPSCFYNDGKLSVFQLGNYEVLFSHQEMNWYEVNDLCKKLGDGWHLPSRVAVIIMVERLNFGYINKLWTSDESTSMPNGNYSGKNWTNSDYNVAEVLEFKTRETTSLYKSDKANFAIARCKGNNFEKVKNNISSASTIGNIKVSSYEIANVTYFEAKNLCAELGEGWRLPTIEELELIKNNGRNCEVDISLCFYWSKTSTCNGCTDSYYSLSLNTSKRNSFDKYSRLRTIPVYSKPAENLPTMNFGNFKVCTKVFGPMTLREAESYCLKLNEGGNFNWKVTTMLQLNSIKQYKSDVPDMFGKTFMSYTPKNANEGIKEDFSCVDIDSRYGDTWISGFSETKYYFLIAR